MSQTEPERPAYTSLSSLLRSTPSKAPTPPTHNETTRDAAPSRNGALPQRGKAKRKKKERLGILQMMALTVSMGGSQVSWISTRRTALTESCRLHGQCELHRLQSTPTQSPQRARIWHALLAIPRAVGATDLPGLAGRTNLGPHRPTSYRGDIRLVDLEVQTAILDSDSNLSPCIQRSRLGFHRAHSRGARGIPGRRTRRLGSQHCFPGELSDPMGS